MKSIVFSITFSVLCCSLALGQIQITSIRIIHIQQDPLNLNPCKKIILLDTNNNLIGEKVGYCPEDINQPICKAHLFDTDTSFTIIDCNGYWYSISKKSSSISKTEWQWEKKLPTNYLGTYNREYGVNDSLFYKLSKHKQLTVKEVYTIKDSARKEPFDYKKQLVRNLEEDFDLLLNPEHSPSFTETNMGVISAGQ